MHGACEAVELEGVRVWVGGDDFEGGLMAVGVAVEVGLGGETVYMSDTV